MLSLFHRQRGRLVLQCCAALQSLRRLAGWGERVLGHSGALKSLSSKTADKDVKKPNEENMQTTSDEWLLGSPEEFADSLLSLKLN